MREVIISDPTLRDGNHAVGHKLTAAQIAAYARAADDARIPIVEVGHGNGLGASSLQVGLAAIGDHEMLATAREQLRHSKLGVHVIPGFGTIRKDIAAAIDHGVDVFRVASHCTEANTTRQHIEYLRGREKEVFGVLMMSHMATRETLRDECLKMESYGAQGVILMDSAGAYVPEDVTERIRELTEHLAIPTGFHAHNNLGLAIANSIAAVRAGATIIDGTARGFGAGAGNTQLEVLVAVLEKLGYSTGVDLYKVLDAADIAERELMPFAPTIKSMSIVSGLAGVFSGFAKPVDRISREYSVDPRDVFFELGKRSAVAGQEDLILEVAMQLAATQDVIA
ncbi:MAG TPA: 4-hydroxy-2-oxovalerate aldolase [Thermoanaerobaculia bacterium]|nr:4-hydroxy-2-oxovalerate aldolase [Thermoanaerobaculia bacterium]